MDENKTNIPAEATEKVPVAGKFWLSFADCMCGTLNSLLTGGGMTYFFTKFMGMDGDRKNSDIILGKAALMAEIACGFEEGSETVLQDIFFKTTTESDDSLWYKGYVFNMSTKEDDNDSKNNIMLFRVFPVTDSLKNEWKLKEYS